MWQKHGKIIYQIPAQTNQQSLFFTLEEQLNTKHSLYILANKIDWEMFEDRCKVLYSQDNGCPRVPIRRIVGFFGDDINIMLSAAAFNFKRDMRLLLRLFSNGFAESTAMMKNLAGTSHRELNIPPHTASSQSVFTYLKEELFEGLLSNIY